MKIKREDLVLSKVTREGVISITSDGGIKFYPDPNLVW